MPAQVSDWFERWSEPQRLRSRHASLDHWDRNARWFGIATSPFLRDWFRPLSEPVRSKPPLPLGASPYLFETINYVQFRFALTETGDTTTMTVNEFPFRPKSNVSVSISEIKVGDMARVSIRDLKDYNE